MATKQTTCQIRVRWGPDDVPVQPATQRLKDIEASPDMTDELRQRWAAEVVNSFLLSPNPTKDIRPWDFLLKQDGSVEALSSEKGGRGPYPSRFRIPPDTIVGLDEEERVQRAEKFALGSLIYEVMTAKEPFEELSDDEVQRNFSRGIFPDDVFEMPMGPFILGCWSLEFEKELLKRLPGVVDRFRAYVRAHPYRFTAQVVGGVITIASVVVLPVLGAIGFGAGGPVAASAAAAWQSSAGLVQAGSLFSWCQSAAMGGAAVNGIIATGVAGGGVTLAATGGAVAGGQVALTPEMMREMFRAVYRNGESGMELTKARV